jgi:hypothetical protein
VALDITPLVNAIDRLREGLARHRSEPADDQLRDGLTQRFEFTYELCHRMLRRFIRRTAASPDAVDPMSFQDLIRTANQQGLLLGDWVCGTGIATPARKRATPIMPMLPGRLRTRFRVSWQKPSTCETN